MTLPLFSYYKIAEICRLASQKPQHDGRLAYVFSCLLPRRDFCSRLCQNSIPSSVSLWHISPCVPGEPWGFQKKKHRCA